MSRKRRRSSGYDDSVYRSLVMITQFGVNMLVPIGMMSALGIWLDGRYHTSFWTILLFFVGAVAGGQNVWRMARSVYAKDSGPKDKRDRKASGAAQGGAPEENVGASRDGGMKKGAGRAWENSGEADSK